VYHTPGKACRCKASIIKV